MTGREIAELMQNKDLKFRLAKHARRYSSCIEDQEEYIQDAWIRIATLKADMDNEYYGEQGRKAMEASYRKEYRQNVDKKSSKNVNGISITGKDIKKKIPERAIQLQANKYLDPKPETLDWQYYEGQEQDVINRVNQAVEWYRQYEDFESLTTKEQKHIENMFRNGGYMVGSPIGGTQGRKTRVYNIMYMIVNGVLENVYPIKPYSPPLRSDWAFVPPKIRNEKVMLDSWYALRKLGGSEEWLNWLDETIASFESLLNH